MEVIFEDRVQNTRFPITSKRRYRVNLRDSLLLAVLLSLSAHMLIYNQLKNEKNLSQPTAPIKLKIVTTPINTPKTLPDIPKKDDDLIAKQILETLQEKTETPEKADFYSHTNHKAQKETVRRPAIQEKALDPGRAKAQEKKMLTKSPAMPQHKRRTAQSKTKPVSNKSQVTVQEPNLENLNYQEFLTNSRQTMTQQAIAGYEEYLKGVAEEGDVIDLNSQEYRYIGYFTMLRKAIELVWVYPTDAARRGFQGKVDMKFTINKDGSVGHVSVLSSSGYRILDDSIVQAISLAAPFAPLPSEMGKEKLVIKGAFSYILSSY